MLIWASIVGTIYSNFLIFYSNFSESENYHKAYYNAISALERWELVVKQREPWYKWSWWWILKVATWTYNNWSDKPIDTGFSYISDSISKSNSPTSSIFWDINSRTTRIPSEGNWNVEWTLAATDSTDYNMMDYEDAEVFLLYYDNNNWSPYDKGDVRITKRQVTPSSKIIWKIRLPARLREWGSDKDFWELDTNKALVWWENELPKNDAIVDRQVKWIYWDTSYTIYSTQSVAWQAIQLNNDTAFRESDINNNLNFKFYNANRNPLSTHWWASRVKIISQSEWTIKNKWSFNNLWGDSLSKENQIRFSLLNLLKTRKNKIYPFLEYYIDFWSTVADKYYTIKAKWNYADYEVNMTIQKPTVKETVLSSFTSIF